MMEWQERRAEGRTADEGSWQCVRHRGRLHRNTSDTMQSLSACHHAGHLKLPCEHASALVEAADAHVSEVSVPCFRRTLHVRLRAAKTAVT